MSRRAVTASDEDFLVRLYASTRDDIAQLAIGAPEKAALVRMQFDAQRRHYGANFPGAEHSIVVVDGRPAGRLYLHRARDEFRIVDLSLLPAHRGRGVGGRLIDEILDEARRACTPVRLHVEHHNRARRLYDRRGFLPIAETDSHTLMEWRPVGGIVIPGSRIASS